MLMNVQSDLAYPVLFYPDPSEPSGRKSLVTDLQHMLCIHTVCVFDSPVPRLSGYFCEKRMCAVKRGLTVLGFCAGFRVLSVVYCG